jgi:hypothetical protein
MSAVIPTTANSIAGALFVARGQRGTAPTRESGRTTVESWRFVKGLQFGQTALDLAADSRPPRPILDLRAVNCSCKILINLEIGDCGGFGAKSRDNYATSSGKRSVKPGL